jgi:hypothetical protein
MESKDIKIIKKMIKSMHKAFCKAFDYSEKNRKSGKDVVQDILDSNYTAEADENKVPPRRTGVMYKSKKKYSRSDVAKKATQALLEKYKKHKKNNL